MPAARAATAPLLLCSRGTAAGGPTQILAGQPAVPDSAKVTAGQTAG